MMFISGLAGVALVSCSSLGGLQGDSRSPDLEVAALLTLLVCVCPHIG